MPDELIEQTSIIPNRPPVDLLTKDGESATESGARLDSIFSLAEKGKPIKEAIASSMEDKPDVPEIDATQEKKVDDKVDSDDLTKKLDLAKDKKDEEVSRDKLLAQTEIKQDEIKVEDKKEIKPDPDAVPEDELKVLPYDKPKTAKRIQALLKKIDSINEVSSQTKKESETKAARLSELENQLKTIQTVDPKTQDEIKQQLDELSMFRRRYELDKDPTVKTKFDSRQESSEKTINDVLTRRNAGADLIKLIGDEGGWSKFAESARPVPVNGKDGKVEYVSSAQLADNILQALPLAERKKIEAAMMDQIQTSNEKARYFEEETNKAKEFFSKRDQEVQSQQENQRKQMSEVQKMIEDFQKTALDKNDWLKEKDIPPTAAPEVKAQMDEDNRYTKQLQVLLKQALNTKDVPGMLSVVMDSVAYYNERRNTARLTTENNKLKLELQSRKSEFDKFRQASRSTTRPGSLTGGGQAVVRQERAAPQRLDLESALSKIESGSRSGEDNE